MDEKKDIYVQAYFLIFACFLSGSVSGIMAYLTDLDNKSV